MGPKKPNRSPFGLFMIKMKRSDGRLKSMPMSQMVSHCAPIYDSLPQDVRKRLEQLSQMVRNKGLSDYDMNRKLDQFSLEGGGGDTSELTLSAASTSHMPPPPPPLQVVVRSNPYEDMSQEDDEEEDAFAILEEVFKNTEDLPKKSLVGICFNVMVLTGEGVYYPNEVGLIEFSLEEGVQRFDTKLIANEVPNGYYGSAKEFSDASHKIPVNCNKNNDFEADFEALFHRIYDFMSNSGLKDGRNRTIVFCKPEDRNTSASDIPQVKGCLEFLDKKIQSLKPSEPVTKSLINDFVILDMTDLLFMTIKTFSTTMRYRNLCIDSLSRSVFDFYLDLRCDLHSEDENNFCALAVIKRTVYLFFDVLFGLPLRPELELKPKESHRPKKPEVCTNTYIMVTSERPIIPSRRQNRGQSESQPEAPAPPPNPALKRLQRTGLGRGRLIENLKIMTNQKR